MSTADHFFSFLRPPAPALRPPAPAAVGEVWPKW
jgi:hypothetical protein